MIIDNLKKWCFCFFFHRKHRCYPEVWKVELGSWHCAKCHPCGEDLETVLKMADNLLSKSVDLDSDIQRAVSENFWDLL